jgi:hypothetical protein
MNNLMAEMLKCLEIRETNSVLGHEQTVSPNLKKLKEAMLNIGHLVDPLIVDKETGVVLDGHHRLKVLQVIECPFLVCQAVDYNRTDITLGTWYPSVSESVDVISKLDSVKLEKVDLDAGKKAIESLKAPFMIWSKKDGYRLVNPGNYKLMEMVTEQNFLLSQLNKTETDFIAEADIQKHLDLGRTILFRRSYTKEEVVKTAKNHLPLPPKSTRHLIPGRIIRLNMKLGWLHLSKEEARRELENMLEHRVYAGNVRKYYEPVTVIY